MLDRQVKLVAKPDKHIRTVDGRPNQVARVFAGEILTELPQTGVVYRTTVPCRQQEVIRPKFLLKIVIFQPGRRVIWEPLKHVFSVRLEL